MLGLGDWVTERGGEIGRKEGREKRGCRR